MARGRTILISVAVALLLPARAIGAPRDVSATHAYLQANYRLAHAMVGLSGAGQAKIEAFNAKLARECPRIGLGSPENEASQPVAHEVAAALWSLDYGADAAPIAAFVRAVGHLRWSSPRINAIARRYARSLHEMATLPLPDLCADVRSWKETGFQTVPPAVVSLASRVDAIELHPIPPRLLAPYERDGDASLLARTKRLETKLAETEFIVGQSDWIQVLETLAVNQ
jgi:hypothetical protein